MKRELAGISFLMITGLVFSALAQEVDYTTEPLDQIKTKVETKKVVLADVRERREWDQGHIRDAVFLPLSQLAVWERDGIVDADKAQLEKSLPKGSIVYCHCAAGSRALPGAQALKKLGYDARPMKTGYRALLKAGFSQDLPK
jgi:rhodanese-related sulfurtransferase